MGSINSHSGSKGKCPPNLASYNTLDQSGVPGIGDYVSHDNVSNECYFSKAFSWRLNTKTDKNDFKSTLRVKPCNVGTENKTRKAIKQTENYIGIRHPYGELGEYREKPFPASFEQADYSTLSSRLFGNHDLGKPPQMLGLAKTKGYFSDNLTLNLPLGVGFR